MFRILTTFLVLSSTFPALGAATMGARSSDRHVDPAETAPADSQFRPGPYVYQNATKLDSGYVLMNINNPGQVGTYNSGFGALTAELKLPDADDPALVWYMPEGPIRFYLPARDASDLSIGSWRYRSCQYRIASVSSEDFFVERLPDLVPEADAFSMLIESQCDDIPGTVVLYLFDFRMGLLSFTLGEIAATERGDNIFQPKETYHLIGYSSGFGEPAGK